VQMPQWAQSLVDLPWYLLSLYTVAISVQGVSTQWVETDDVEDDVRLPCSVEVKEVGCPVVDSTDEE